LADFRRAKGGSSPSTPAQAGAAAQVFVGDPERPVLSLAQRHHLTRVMRLREGELVVAADGKGSFSLCRFTLRSGVGRQPGAIEKSAIVRESPVFFEPRPPYPIGVAFVPAKGERPEWVVQKLTELGVDEIVVLRSRRAVVRWDEERERRAMAHLEAVALEAAAQSRRAWLPGLRGVVHLDDLSEVMDGPLRLSAARREEGDESGVGSAGGAAAAQTAAQTAAQAAAQDVRRERTVALADRRGDAPDSHLRLIAVGPEGGFDPAELEAAPRLVGLSKKVLRSETAAVVAGFVLAAMRDRWVAEVARVRSGACNCHAT
jgi:16S rRNA (uracil1498-N3)-methyltransferase